MNGLGDWTFTKQALGPKAICRIGKIKPERGLVVLIFELVFGKEETFPTVVRWQKWMDKATKKACGQLAAEFGCTPTVGVHKIDGAKVGFVLVCHAMLRDCPPGSLSRDSYSAIERILKQNGWTPIWV